MAYSLINDISTSGSITAAAQNVFLNISGHSAGSVQITGTWVGTMGFEGTTDGTTWLPINGVSAASSAPTPNASANALYRITPGGLTSFRILSSAWTSGTAVITIRASSGVGGVFANQILPARITDGTNTVSIKAANTAAAATDLPLVVALHPTSPTPNFLAAQAVTGTRLNNGTSSAAGSTHLTIGGTDGTNLRPILLDSTGRQSVIVPAEGVVSTVNSTTVVLAANATFTGTSEDVTNYSSVTVGLISNVASATDGLQLQQSFDGTIWDLVDIYSVPAATGKTFSAHISAKFFRIVYTNGATLQTSFRLQSIYHKYQQPASTVRPQDGRSNDNDFGEELAFLMGYNSIANAWNRVGITSGNLGGNETLLDRLKVNASLRMIDIAQAVGSQLVGATGTQALGLNVNLRTSATLAVTITAATGVAATLTLPAVAAQFHYIISLKMVLYSTAARTGAATPIIVTSTNLPGTIAYTFETAGAIGTNTPIQGFDLAIPLKSSVVNTATTIVAPIVTNGIWRITATYFTGA